MEFLSKERQKYYRTKRREHLRKNQDRLRVKQDALFVKHYGMSAFLEFFPEAKDFGMSWHEELVQELEKLEKKRLGQLLGGIYMASGATKSKSVNRRFKRLIKSLIKW